MLYTNHSEQETINLGKKLTAQFKGGDVVCLYGELGAGKTTLVKGMAGGLGVKEEITSPTFTLMNVYKCHSRHAPPKARLRSSGAVGENRKLGRRSNGLDPRLRGDDKLSQPLIFVHIDTYRLKNAQELLEIGVEDYLGKPDTVCVVEWPEKIEGLLEGKNLVEITMKHGEGNSRVINLKSKV